MKLTTQDMIKNFKRRSYHLCLNQIRLLLANGPKDPKILLLFKAHALLHMGKIYIQNDNLQDAHTCFEEAISLLIEQNWPDRQNNRLLAYAYHCAATCVRDQLPLCHKYLERSLALYEVDDNCPTEIATIKFALAKVIIKESQQNSTKAQDYLQATTEHFSKLDSSEVSEIKQVWCAPHGKQSTTIFKTPKPIKPLQGDFHKDKNLGIG